MYRRGTLLILTGATHHLHIVMNDPVFSAEHSAHSILLVNISSVKEHVPYDATCVLDAGCHPFVKRQSYVSYAHAVVSNAGHVEVKMAAGEIIQKDDVSEDIFTRVLQGFFKSDQVTPKILRFMKNCMRVK